VLRHGVGLRSVHRRVVVGPEAPVNLVTVDERRFEGRNYQLVMIGAEIGGKCIKSNNIILICAKIEKENGNQCELRISFSYFILLIDFFN